MRDQNLNKLKTIKELKGPTPGVRQFLGSESQGCFEGSSCF